MNTLVNPMRLVLVLALFCATYNIPAGASSVTKDSVESVAKNRPVFLKFFAPWCGHCKAMAPDWSRLMTDFKDSDTVFVGEVDCTADGKDLCSDVGVQGYPTIKYGDLTDLQDYKGARSYEAMKKHADTAIKPQCSFERLSLCTEEQKKELEEIRALSASELSKLIQVEEEKISTAEKDFELGVQDLQAKYAALQQTKEETLSIIKTPRFAMLKSAIKQKNANGDKNEL
tara:strand:+ start:411 stop:1097 length:687 start_codon:yes stop_codon:yes gene_type:complete